MFADQSCVEGSALSYSVSEELVAAKEAMQLAGLLSLLARTDLPSSPRGDSVENMSEERRSRYGRDVEREHRS